MEFVITQDGSYTLFHDDVAENQHSITAGAITEAREKHVFPLQLENGMRILDFCFGLGYNSIVAAYYFSNLEIIGLEKEEAVLEKLTILAVPPEWEKAFLPFRQLAKKKSIQDEKMNSVSVLLGDGLKTMYKLQLQSFDRIFFDPFSPKKQPEMWSEEVFLQMYRLLKPQGKLSTYSCANGIRKNMLKAGFQVIDGPAIGRKSPSTIALKQ
jgi:chorismate dehydratase